MEDLNYEQVIRQPVTQLILFKALAESYSTRSMVLRHMIVISHRSLYDISYILHNMDIMNVS